MQHQRENSANAGGRAAAGHDCGQLAGTNSAVFVHAGEGVTGGAAKALVQPRPVRTGFPRKASRRTHAQAYAEGSWEVKWQLFSRSPRR